MAEFGINIHDLEELESDAGLGNGGLGRLAACFMDSLASLAYPGHGHTIRYEFGLFKQKIENGYQIELPDQWMQTGFNWEVRKPKHRVPVKFFGKIVYNDATGKYEHIDTEEVYAVPYDVPIIGNDTTTTNTLRLWGAEASENIPANQDFRHYIQNVRDICQMLYPDDSTPAGKMLRLKLYLLITRLKLNPYLLSSHFLLIHFLLSHMLTLENYFLYLNVLIKLILFRLLLILYKNLPLLHLINAHRLTLLFF